MHFFAADLLVSEQITLNYLVLHGCDFGDMSGCCFLEDSVYRDLVVYIGDVKRAF